MTALGDRLRQLMTEKDVSARILDGHPFGCR